MTAYDIHTHQFRFAIWAASRAYARSQPDTGMPIPYDTARDAGLHRITSPDHIGNFELIGLDTPTDLDESDTVAVVDAWTTALIQSIQAKSVPHRLEAKSPLPFGCAAKLLSIYLKAVLLNEANIRHPKIALMHPPIDNYLLRAITSKSKDEKKSNLPAYKALFQALHPGTNKQTLTGFSWQKMTQSQYLNIIKSFRAIKSGKPIWMIEEDWSPRLK